MTAARRRSHASARSAGTRFESMVAGYLRDKLADDRIERRARTGAQDRGDIAGVRHQGERLVIECKNTARPALAAWADEAEIERGNDDAIAGLVVHKRHGVAAPGDQWVTLTLRDLVALLNGRRDEEDQP
ncbi:PDDEXK family nuclease [Actinomyces howellii]|uniref:Holliday junction resolvase n=1 Tax=Actinomyces howellii TaxID=52771 RepID=A0A448HGM9_9ACTO|nr:hypothetical protein [Actinomyces howellii]VEG28020.1 Uncharacterised protein [Actinomyces howellii]